MHKLSRQQVWQEKKRAQGLCIRCGCPRLSGSKAHCEVCLDQIRARYTPKGIKSGRPLILRTGVR